MKRTKNHFSPVSQVSFVWSFCGILSLHVFTGCVSSNHHLKMKQEMQKKIAEKDKQNEKLKIESKEWRSKSQSLSDELLRLAKDRGMTEKELRKQLEKIKGVYSDLNRSLKGLVQAGNLKIDWNQGMLTLQLPDQILFDTARSDVKEKGRVAIEEIAKALKKTNQKWQIVGHTDNTGEEDFNWKLSTNRALSVLNVMLKSGLSPKKVSVAGFGPHKPAAPNSTSQNRALNRRTELVLVPNLAPIFKKSN